MLCLVTLPLPLAADDFQRTYSQLTDEASQDFHAFNQDIETQYNQSLLRQWWSFSSPAYLQNEAVKKPQEQPARKTERRSTKEDPEQIPEHIQEQLQPIIIRPPFEPELLPSDSAPQDEKLSFYGHSLLPPPPLEGGESLPEFELSILADWLGSDRWRNELVDYRQNILKHKAYPHLLAYFRFLSQAYTQDNWAKLVLAQRLCHLTFALDSSVVVCSWLLAQAESMDVRLANYGSGFLLLVRADNNWLDHPYFELSSGRFFVFNKAKYQRLASPSLLIHQAAYPGADRAVNVTLVQGLKPAFKNVVYRRVPDNSKGIQVKLDRDQLRYLSHLPVLPIGEYLNTEPSVYVIEQLAQHFAGNRPVSRAGQRVDNALLLPVVQWLQWLPYQTDDVQFGYEKPMTLEELLYYSASDCEDRVYALSAIFRTLWQLEVAALKFPQHLSAAVKLNGQWQEIDPTYAGSGFNERQPALQSIKADWQF